jgi:hypothetical protein
MGIDDSRREDAGHWMQRQSIVSGHRPRPGPWIWYRGALGVRDRRKRPKSLFPFLCDIMDDDAQQGSELHRLLPQLPSGTTQ